MMTCKILSFVFQGNLSMKPFAACGRLFLLMSLELLLWHLPINNQLLIFYIDYNCIIYIIFIIYMTLIAWLLVNLAKFDHMVMMNLKTFLILIIIQVNKKVRQICELGPGECACYDISGLIYYQKKTKIRFCTIFSVKLMIIIVKLPYSPFKPNMKSSFHLSLPSLTCALCFFNQIFMKRISSVWKWNDFFIPL